MWAIRRGWLPLLLLLSLLSPTSLVAQESPQTSPLFDLGRALAQQIEERKASLVLVKDALERWAATRPLEYHFHGNQVILRVLLERMLALPTEVEVDEAFLRSMEEQVEALYHELGYDLARVLVAPQGRVIEIIIDEGRVDKILFAGSGALNTFDLRNSLHLPSKTYNRFWLEEELERLRQLHGFVSMTPRLATRAHTESILQLEEFLASGGEQSIEEIWISSRGQYELVIDCEKPEGQGGFSYGTNYRPPLGLQVFFDYKNKNFLLDGDRYLAGTTAFVDTSSPLNRVSLNGEWKAPNHLVDWLRFRAFADLDLLSQSRDDVGVLDYWRIFPSFGLGLEAEPMAGLEITFTPGYAYEYLTIDGVAEDVRVDSEDIGRHMPFLEFGVRWFEESTLPRREHPHELKFDYRTFLFWTDDDVDQYGLQYRRLFELGFDDIIVSAKAGLVRGGGVRWQDEQTLASEILRAVASDNYSREHLQLGLQYRVSLVRDLAKVGLTAGLALVGDPDRGEDDADPLGLFSFGPSAHLLVLDSFQLDVFYSFGFSHRGDLTEAVGFNFAKIY